MVKNYVFQPQGVCSRQMNISIEDGVIKELAVIGGCNGNLQGISKLVTGRRVDEVAGLLRGVDCGGRGTSCPDQLARALEKIAADPE